MKVEPGQVKGIFLHAVEHCAPGEWGAYLDEACGENAELRRRVMILLEAHQTADSLIDPPEPTATFGAGNDGADPVIHRVALDRSRLGGARSSGPGASGRSGSVGAGSSPGWGSEPSDQRGSIVNP